MSDFDDEITRLCSKELPHARNDPERAAAMVGALSGALDFTIAVTTGGDARAIDELCEGISTRLLEGAAEHAPLARAIAAAASRGATGA